jgi:hypothetical protein
VLARVTFAITEAFLVALILAVAIDPYLKVAGFRDAASAISEDLFWESVNPACPPEYKIYLKDIARTPRYARKCFTRIEFAWEDANRRILQLLITREFEGVNLAGVSWRPDRQLWLLSSTDGFESAYLSWQLSIPQQDDFFESLSSAHLKRGLRTRDDGTLCLDELRLAEKLPVRPVVPPGAEFTSVLKARMYRASRGFLPLISRSPIRRSRVRCEGAAVSDLQISCMFGSELLEKDPDSAELTFVQPRIAGPAEGFMLSWKPLINADKAA